MVISNRKASAGYGTCYMDAAWKEAAIHGPNSKYNAMKACAECRRTGRQDHGNIRHRTQWGD